MDLLSPGPRSPLPSTPPPVSQGLGINGGALEGRSEQPIGRRAHYPQGFCETWATPLPSLCPGTSLQLWGGCLSTQELWAGNSASGAFAENRGHNSSCYGPSFIYICLCPYVCACIYVHVHIQIHIIISVSVSMSPISNLFQKIEGLSLLQGQLY